MLYFHPEPLDRFKLAYILIGGSTFMKQLHDLHYQSFGLQRLLSVSKQAHQNLLSVINSSTSIFFLVSSHTKTTIYRNSHLEKFLRPPILVAGELEEDMSKLTND